MTSTASTDAPVAAIDCGTNSIRLLIARSDPTAPDRLIDVVRKMEVVRLGASVDSTGRISDESMKRTFAAARAYRELCHQHSVGALRFVATSATRDAHNRDDFVSGVESILGVEPEVVSGAEEAELSFRGAVSSPALALRERPYLVVDLGGGSTELVLGSDAPVRTFSIDLGCVRLTERHLHDDPPTPAQIAAAVEDIDTAIDEADTVIDFGKTKTLVGVAGSITTVTAKALRLDRYDPTRIDGAAIPRDDVLAACGELLQLSRVERAEEPYMHPGRIDVIGAGALLWSRIVARVVTETALAGTTLGPIMTSEHDILDGIALSIAAG